MNKQSKQIIVKAGLLWDGRNPEIIPDILIIIEQGVIRQIGPSNLFSADLEYDLDWSGLTVMPGLIDSHTHLSMDPRLDNYLDRMTDSADQLTTRAMHMMGIDLRAGVTTCRCLGDRELVDITCKEVLQNQPLLGPELLIAIRGIKKNEAPGFVGYPFPGVAEMRQAVVENVELGADLIKCYITGTLKNGQEIQSYLSYEEIEGIIEQSHELGVRTAAHCVGGIGLDWALELGLDTVEHLYQVTDSQIEILAKSKTWAVMTPGPILTELRVQNLPESLIAGHIREKEAITQNMSAVINAGIPYAVGTDGMHGDLLQEMKYLIQMGASTYEALSAATYHGACASGIDNSTGSLEIGKRADLIAVRGNPLKDIEALSRISAVMKKGELISLVWCLLLLFGCVEQNQQSKPRISLVNSPTDIVTQGAQFLAEKIKQKSGGNMQPEVFHSGMLSGGKGLAEIEMCQQGSIQMHITSTAYLSNLVPRTSIFSLPFMFRDLDQVVGLVKSNSATLDQINRELNQKNLNVIAWWPRGFRQLTNSRRPVTSLKDIQGLKFRVMNNQLFVDNINAMGAHPVPMEWGEVYNGLQLKTIDGQENAEGVIYSSRLYEIQPYMTVWDYSIDLEVVLVNHQWWMSLTPLQQQIILEGAESSVKFQIELLKKDTEQLREKIHQSGVSIYYLDHETRNEFKSTIGGVWDKYQLIFGSEFMSDFIEEIKSY